MKRAVFLDRDGVINQVKLQENRPHPPQNLEEFEYLEESKEAVLALINKNFVVVVVTNQPDITRKTLTESLLADFHAKIGKDTNIKHFYVCPHDDADECNCRKPKPGLILKAAQDLEIDLANSFLVGDRWKDISAGQRAGCTNFFINNNYSERQPEMPYIAVSSLKEATSIILESYE